MLDICLIQELYKILSKRMNENKNIKYLSNVCVSHNKSTIVSTMEAYNENMRYIVISKIYWKLQSEMARNIFFYAMKENCFKNG